MAIVASGQVTIIDLNDARQFISYIGSSQSKTVIHDPSTSTYVPNYSTTNQILTPQLFVAGSSQDLSGEATSTRWYYLVNSGGEPVEITESTSTYVIGSGATKTLTIKSNVFSQETTSMKYICEMIYPDASSGLEILTKSEIELVKVSNGQRGKDGAKGDDGLDALTAVLSNDSSTIATETDGTGGNYESASTTISIFIGSVDDTENWTVTATSSDGVVGSLVGKTYSVTSMSEDSGYVDLIATREGYATLTRRFTISKSKAGSGENATTYWLVVNASAIAKSRTGEYTPSSILIGAKSQTGASTPMNYNGRLRISESTDGTTFVTKYTSSVNEYTYTYPASGTFPSDIKAIKVELFMSGGTANKLDEQLIPVVADGIDGEQGRDGTSAILVNVWTPSGNTLKNSIGTLSAQADVYDGVEKVIPTSYKWYIQDPSATTSSGGDSDGGNGWRLLNDIYNTGVTGWDTDTIIIPPDAIVGVESFKCVALYNGNNYEDVCTVMDITDPVAVMIIGVNTFKNGQGSTELTAKLYRNGSEIDVNGTEHTYSWSIYDASGNTTSFSASGKTITVNADDVNVRGNIVCEVSK